MRLKLRQIILGTLLLASAAQAKLSGTESGGGGGVLMRAPQPVLLDFLRVDLNFQEPASYRGKTSSRISATEMEQKFSFTPRNETQVQAINPAFDVAINILKQWQDLKFDMAGAWTSYAFYEPLSWTFTHKNLAAPVYLPQGVPTTEKTAIAAYYHAKPQESYGVQISIPIWNQLGVVSQSGVLIHEALRHLQMGMSFKFDEQSLQQSTAIFMMCKPKARLGYYVRYLLLNSPELAEQLYGTFENVIQKDCERIL